MTTDRTITDTVSDTTESADLRTAGMAAMRRAMPGVFPDGEVDLRDGRLGEDLVDIGTSSVWGALWGREGLGFRDRSLVTVSLLIALGAHEELKTHARIAMTNGVTRDELAEVLYHAAGYTGFPAAVAARTAVRAALGE